MGRHSRRSKRGKPLPAESEKMTNDLTDSNPAKKGRHRGGKKHSGNSRTSSPKQEMVEEPIPGTIDPSPSDMMKTIQYPFDMYYIGISYENGRVYRATLPEAKEICKALGESEKEMMFIFTKEGIRIYPPTPMRLTGSNFYYVQDPLIRNEKVSTFHDLSEAIQSCANRGAGYNVYDQYHNRVY